VVPATNPPISKEAVDLIVYYETGGHQDYNQLLIHPTWPGLSSGVTVGVGYDCGQTSRLLIQSDWTTLRDDWRTDLANTSGITGQKAKPVARGLSYISIDWSMANQVFYTATLPQYWSLTKRTFPGVQNLCPNAAGALTSLVYNRGSSMVGSSREEMRQIRDLVPKKDYAGIADQIRSMKRLWTGQGMDGLLRRRDAEAQLVETCLK
jgi:GH24 family phage-related lysozyme (muramidase)